MRAATALKLLKHGGHIPGMTRRQQAAAWTRLANEFGTPAPRRRAGVTNTARRVPRK